MSLFDREQLGHDLEAEERALAGNPQCPAVGSDLLEAVEIAEDEREEPALRKRCARRLAGIFGVESLSDRLRKLLEDA